MSAFEIITEDQYQASHSGNRVEGAGVSTCNQPVADAHPRIYCEFCKGWYNEYHVERWEEVKS